MATAAIVASLVSSCGEKEASEEAPKAREVAVQTQTPKESLKTEKETVPETDLETIVPTPDQITEVPEETTEAIFLELYPGYDIDWEPIPAGKSDEELTLAFFRQNQRLAKHRLPRRRFSWILLTLDRNCSKKRYS